MQDDRKYYSVAYAYNTANEQGHGTTVFWTKLGLFVPAEFNQRAKIEAGYTFAIATFWEEITKEHFDLINNYNK